MRAAPGEWHLPSIGWACSLGQRVRAPTAVAVDDVLSLTRAARVSGIGKDSLRAAIEDGRLEAELAQRHHKAGRFGTRTHYQIALHELDRFVASLSPCPYPGCERLGTSPLGFCCGGHAAGVLTKGIARPEVAAKLSAAQRGKPKGPRGYCAPVRETWARLLASPDGDGLRRARSERMREWWKTGKGAPPVVLRLKATGRTRQRYFGKWAATKPPGPGARPRGRPTSTVDPEHVAMVERYAERGWGYRTIAATDDVRDAGLSAYQVREIVRAFLTRANQPTLFQRT